MKTLTALICGVMMAASAGGALSDSELEEVGKRVWKNECGGTREGLTSWNTGEKFASLGIGHFIWYPRGTTGPFEESFPKLVEYLGAHGVKVPQWLKTSCPWSSREEFQKAFHSTQMEELRALLASSIRVQSRFLAQRMEQALPKMLASAPAKQRDHIREQFQRLSGSAAGSFALIDYVNFKGEGTSESERYKGEGWGLLQVLARMRADRPAVQEFSKAAEEVLERRVQNSPPGRNEARWLPGWTARVRSY